MKRQLIIYLTDGTKVEKDLTEWIREMQSPKIPAAERLPVNPPANHHSLKVLVQSFAMGGFEMEGSTAGLVTYVAPSQIKSLQIKFDANLTLS